MERLSAVGCPTRRVIPDPKKPLWDVPKIVGEMSVPPTVIIRWEEHSCTFINQEWRDACKWCHENGILPMQLDWGYFDHYHSLLLNVHEADGSPSIKRFWPELPEKPQWKTAGASLKAYREYMANEWRIATQLGPVPGTKRSYVLIYQQNSAYLSSLGATSYEDWCRKAQEAIQATGKRVVWKKTRQRKIALPEGSLAFDENDGIPHLNTRLLRFAKHSVVVNSTVTHEAVLRNLPVVTCGRSWHSGLGVFAEAKDWSDLAVTPKVDRAARGKWVNWWHRTQFPPNQFVEKLNQVIAEYRASRTAAHRRGLYCVGIGMGNLIMGVPAMKALAGLDGGGIDVASRHNINRGYLELLEDQPFVRGVKQTLPNLSEYDFVTGAAFVQHTPGVPPGVQRVPPGVQALFPHEVLRDASPARRMGYNRILPSSHLRIPLPKVQLPTSYVVVGMDCTDGGSWSFRRWPHWEKFAELWGGRCPLVFVGVKKAPWIDKCGINLVGKTSPREVGAILQQADAYVGIDNGPSHLAAAARTPSVVLYGCTTSLANGPWHSSVTALAADVPCRPCIFFRDWNRCQNIRCMAEISPERVVKNLELVLQRHGEPVMAETYYEQASARMTVGQRIKAPCAQRVRELAALWALLSEMQPRVVVEIGSLRGGWLYAIAPTCQLPSWFLGIDPADNDSRNRVTFELNKEGREIYWLKGDSHDKRTLEEAQRLLGKSPIDVLHIDGDHSEAGVLKDWEMYGPLVRPGGLVLFHDADNPTEEVPAAFAKIRKSRPANVSEFRLIVDPHGTPPLGIGVARIK